MQVASLFATLGIKIDPSWNAAQAKIRAMASLGRQRSREMALQAQVAARNARRAFLEQARHANSRDRQVRGLLGGAARMGGMGGFGMMGGPAGVALAAGAAGKKIMDLADTYTLLHNRLNLLTGGDQQKANALFEKTSEIAKNTRSDLETTTEGFVRISLATKSMGLSQEGALEFTERIQKAIKLSGATTIEASQGLRQLTQGLAKGKLDGDEFRTMAESLPSFLKLLGQAAGKTEGEIREMSQQGKITPKFIVEAFKKMGPQIDRDFARTVPTFAEHFQQFKNEVLKVFGELFSDPQFKKDAKEILEALIPVMKALAYVIKASATTTSLLIKGLKTLFGLTKQGTPEMRAAFKTLIMAINPITGLVIAIKSLSEAWDQLKADTVQVWDSIVSAIDSAVDAISDALDWIVNKVTQAWEAIKDTPVIGDAIAIIGAVRGDSARGPGAFDMMRNPALAAQAAPSGGFMQDMMDEKMGKRMTMSPGPITVNINGVKGAEGAVNAISAATRELADRQARHTAAAVGSQ